MLRQLVLFRHGKAVRPNEAPDDFSRALTPRGRVEAAAQAKALADLGFVAECALVSTAARALGTWEEAAPYFAAAELRATRTLYLAPPELYFASASAAKVANVLLIAHDPGLHDLSCALLSDDAAGAQTLKGQALLDHMPTAGIAWFIRDTSTGPWRLKAHLRAERD